MSADPTASVGPNAAPMQFTLRQAAAWITALSAALALLSQIGTWWGLVLWLTAGAAVLGYAAWRGWVGWIGMFLVGAGFVLYLLSLASTPRY